MDGWLHTGDIGRLDPDGYLVLVDRAKDMIIRGGENIYPKEVEAVVYELAEVSAAAVVGRPSVVYGEEPVLFVALNSPGALTTEQILAHCRVNLSKYKLPVEITILDKLPCNAVGKIDKPALAPPRAHRSRVLNYTMSTRRRRKTDGRHSRDRTMIMADAAHLLLTAPASETAGNFLLDDDVLADAGVTDFEGYRAVPGDADLQLDLFLDA